MSVALASHLRPLFLAGALSIGAAVCEAQIIRPVPVRGPFPVQEVRTRPPVVSSNLTLGVAPLVGEVLTFDVTVTDPDGDAVALRCVDPPVGLQFQPVRSAPSPLVQRVRWRIPHEMGGFRRITFEANDLRRPARTVRLPLELRVDGQCKPDHVLTGDVTGDGLPDAIAAAQFAGPFDTGAVYVWAGAPTPAGTPTATLTAPVGTMAKLGDLYHAGADNQAAGQGVQLVDLTGDGVLDVVVGAWRASPGGVTSCGGLYLWAGGPGLTGALAPTAVLGVTGAAVGDSMGQALSGQSIQVVDVTADGQLDLVVTARAADPGGIVDTGAVYVWAGGGPFTGTVAPSATLTVPGALPFDSLGFAGINPAQGVLVADVTGDGLPDVIAGASLADAGPVTDTGALYVWAGGPGLVGAPAPSATLTVPGALTGDQLGEVRWGQPIRIADVTGEGTLDLVVGAVLADVAGVVDAGAVYVWHGGPTLAGPVPPSAILTDPVPAPGDRLGFVETGSGIHCVEVNGDVVLDVIVGSSVSDTGGVTDSGVIHVWYGRPTLVGPLPPDATLFVPGALPGDRLGYVDTVFVPGIQFGDVTGDMVLDVIVGASQEDVGGVPNTGAVHVWTGGPGLIGPLAPNADLVVPGAASGDRLGFTGFGAALGSHGLMVVDMTGDGRPDVVAAAPYADAGGLTDAGAVYRWDGGPGLVGAVPPTATFTVPAAVAFDQLALVDHGRGLHAADVTADGLLDLITTSTYTDVAGTVDAGAIHVFVGGPSTGPLGPSATLTVPGAFANDLLGRAAVPAVVGTLSSHAVRLEDADGDGQLDVIAAAMSADNGVVADAGAVYVWRGGPALGGPVAPSASLTVPGASASDLLGAAREGQGVRLADVTGDGIPDLIVTASFAFTTAPAAGGVYLWPGPVLASLPPAVVLSVPGATPFDTLGL